MVLPTLAPGGMEVVVARLTNGLSRRGHRVGVTCLEQEGPLADELRAGGHHVSLVPAPRLRAILRPTSLEAWLRVREPDVVHVHSGAWLKAARAARMAGVPHVVHTIHGLLDREPWYGPALKRWAARYTDRVVAVSKPLADYLIGSVRLPARMVTVIPNGIDVKTFRPAPPARSLRAALGLDDAALLVGTVGRLTAVKNHADLLSAFALIERSIPNASLVIVGDGPLRASLERQVVDLGLEGRVRFLGAARDLASTYRELDLFVLSSMAEGTSMSLLEAMASGVCTLATAVGGTPDVLGSGGFGLLVPPRDPTALARAMHRLLRDPKLRSRLAAAARQRVEEGYNEVTMLDRYEQEYAAAATARRAGQIFVESQTS